MMKRIFFFLLTNIAFILTLTIILNLISFFFPNVLNLSELRNNGNLINIFIYAGIAGFTSSFISLFLSKFTAKIFTKTEIIKHGMYKNEKERFISETVERMARDIGIKMPEVGIYQDDSPNAFATGWSKNHSLVSFSSGLINLMNNDELEAVIAHEMSHIKNGDMVTMTLIQGVVNTFVIAISRIIANIVNEYTESTLWGEIIYFVTQILLGFLSFPIVAYFSRIREYAADKESTFLMKNGKSKMIEALKKLQSINNNEDLLKENKCQAFGIKSEKESSWLSTHPTLTQRIERLKMY